MKKKFAALIYGDNLHYLDHLAPLCFFLNIPIVINEKTIFELCRQYYPDVLAVHVEDLKINYYIVENFDCIITCITKELFDKDFRLQQDLLDKEIEIIWTPHGFSDKGNTCPFFESLKNSKKIFVYGKKMINVLKEKKVLDTIKNYYEIGNYRVLYYQKFLSFYRKIIKERINDKLPKNNINILYAPTWDDFEKSSSFWNNFELLFNDLPQDYNLIVKLHPNLIKKNEIRILLLKERENKKNILFVDDITMIYPLLDYADIYLGDFSSIGYDFLYFNKPMFFLPPANNGLYSSLYECGHLIKNNKIFQSIKSYSKNDEFMSNMTELYENTFTKEADLKNIFAQLQKTY
ncbi:MAG: CDP-glycerol glycerophosphotransferase family protein [Parachlamydiales bacterium]|jgi:hypothetical protein